MTNKSNNDQEKKKKKTSTTTKRSKSSTPVEENLKKRGKVQETEETLNKVKVRRLERSKSLKSLTSGAGAQIVLRKARPSSATKKVAVKSQVEGQDQTRNEKKTTKVLKKDTKKKMKNKPMVSKKNLPPEMEDEEEAEEDGEFVPDPEELNTVDDTDEESSESEAELSNDEEEEDEMREDDISQEEEEEPVVVPEDQKEKREFYRMSTRKHVQDLEKKAKEAGKVKQENWVEKGLAQKAEDVVDLSVNCRDRLHMKDIHYFELGNGYYARVGPVALHTQEGTFDALQVGKTYLNKKKQIAPAFLNFRIALIDNVVAALRELKKGYTGGLSCPSSDDLCQMMKNLELKGTYDLSKVGYPEIPKRSYKIDNHLWIRGDTVSFKKGPSTVDWEVVTFTRMPYEGQKTTQGTEAKKFDVSFPANMIGALTSVAEFAQKLVNQGKEEQEDIIEEEETDEDMYSEDENE